MIAPMEAEPSGLNRTRRMPSAREAVAAAKRGRIDDTLATADLFDLTPEELLGDAPPPHDGAIAPHAAGDSAEPIRSGTKAKPRAATRVTSPALPSP